MLKPNHISFLLLCITITICVAQGCGVYLDEDVPRVVGPLVRKDKRQSIVETEFGRISAVEVNDGIKGPYHLQFITLDPNSLFLPVLLHADMVFYVQTGSGRVSWTDEDGESHADIKRGDIYRIRSGSVFFVTSNLETERQKLRIRAIFTHEISFEYSQQLYSAPYSTLNNLIRGFDRKVLEAAFQVSGEVIDRITRTGNPPPIVHAPTNKTEGLDWTERIFQVLDPYNVNSKKKKTKTFNILEAKPDFSNCNGWSKAVNRKDLKALKGSNIGVFMVNLTQGSMMGPHWNPRATEIAIVVQGQGIVRVVCPSMANPAKCKTRSFRVAEGDVFAIPRFHPMAQMAFNNDTFVFVGFSTMARKNYPQFLAGKSSVLQTLDKDVVAMSFSVPNKTVDELLSSEAESIILECVSCAEEEEIRIQKEEEKERKEEEREREEEEAERRREEEEEKERREEEEAKRKREEEEMKRKEEEETARREEDRRREEQREAEKEQQKKEEEMRRQEEEAARRQEEEMEERREKEREAEKEQERRKEEARRQEEEEARRQQEQREAEKEQEKREEAARRQEEEEARRQEEEREARRQAEKEATRQEEEGGAGTSEEEAAREQEEERKARRREDEGWGVARKWGRKEVMGTFIF
ncbi:hypothetical protein ACHQM5_017040 [Ranunculus cassubicifolius]